MEIKMCPNFVLYGMVITMCPTFVYDEFPVESCRQQGQTNHSVDKVNHIQTMQLGATKFFSELGNVGSGYATLYLRAENTIMPGLQGWVPGEVLLRYGPKPRGNIQTNTIQQLQYYKTNNDR